jgi:hypothetical protein
LKPPKKKRSPELKPVHWCHLPHEALHLEIVSRVLRREPFEADREVRLEYLCERLTSLDLEEHDEYINHIAFELKRELRICRDVYQAYLSGLNTRSSTAKARVALDFAVGPLASRRLREEIIVYVRRVAVGDLMFASLFCPLTDRLVMHPNFISEWLDLERTILGLVPDSCFQELKEATSRELSSLAAGPFSNPAQPFERVLIPLDGSEIVRKPNAIWDDRNMLLGWELWRLWDFVFREICAQHAVIDCDERSNIAFALTSLNPFERLAGRMYFEVSDKCSMRVPDIVFTQIGQELDKARIPLLGNLGANGKEILNHLAKKGKPTTSWEAALADKSEYQFLPTNARTREEATTLKQFGRLSRCAKQAFYRAKDNYQKALTEVYEQRIPAPRKLNPFEPKASRWD